eukprot:CAMPEP_0206445612 /NCGR_PEP_ID=MMETSP0324_2-20121206/15625_1 /ASSEMBLY_ACC=CAM_ASM_000836 /TAXON_ID=2866 /ORGANISM="Crypthecodinium cohnii, Strain Seligo" /LENGTH=424 /DNA_ID=CAMNT_0053913887 /DNA_START=47 /DNA_END=1321 /DNA_ORIENTATION=+
MSMLTLGSSLAAAAALPAASAAFSFASIGDWGGATIKDGDDYHKASEVAVAKEMGTWGEEMGFQFVLNTGDNFYYCGVHNITDAQFKETFEDIYTDKSLMVPWYGVLGNHDYAYDTKAQMQYKSPNNDRWQLQDYYWSKRVLLGGNQYLTIIFIDTNPCIQSYRNDSPSGWDPCSGQFGECKQGPEQKCYFHDHIVAQDCSAQFAWFQKALKAVPEDDWLFVVGHHEADQINVEDFTGAMLTSKMALYLNGHTHAMKRYQIDGRTDMDFMTTGAGCMIRTLDQETCKAGEACAAGSEQNKHMATQIFYKKVSAFSVHTFADDFSSLTTKFIDATGNIIYQFVTQKPGSGPAPSPSPSPAPTPSPAPSPTGSCKAFKCNTYRPGRSCQCNSACRYHEDCCPDYFRECGKEADTMAAGEEEEAVVV